MTPYDFSMLSGIGVGGHSIPYDIHGRVGGRLDLSTRDTPTSLPIGDGAIQLVRGAVLGDRARNTLEVSYARGFLIFLFGTTLFANMGNIVGLYLLSALVDLSQLWVYAYFPTLTPESEVEMAPVVPYSHWYDARCLRRTRETFPFFRRYFDTVTTAEITWQPWATMSAGVRDLFAGSWGASRYRLLFEGPTMGLLEPVVPMAPLPSMRATKRLTFQEMIQFTEGLEADYFHGEGNYSTFIRIHRMPSLTGIRGGEGVEAPPARGRARVPRVATATRAHGPTHTTAPGAAAAPTPAMLPPTVGRRERQVLARSRGRARGTRDESGPSEPILRDDDAKMSGSEKVVSPQSESSESGDDGNSSSESGDADAATSSETESGDSTNSDSHADKDSAPESLPL
ncbi:hypothetical protein CsSME_00015055 [Camellia sinensis var. sinensis]